MGVRDILVLVMVCGSLPFCFFRPAFGVVMWQILSFLNPQDYAYGQAGHTPLAEMVAIATLAGFVLFSPDWRNLFSRNLVLLVILWAWFTLTTVHNTQLPEFIHFSADTWYRWRFVSKILLMTVVTAAILSTWERLRWVLLAIGLCFGVLILKAVPFMILTAGTFRLYGPPGSMLADNNDFGLALNMTLPIFFFLAQTEQNKKMRWFMWLLVACTIPAVLFTWSRGALMGLIAVMLLMLMRLNMRQKMALAPLLLMAAAIAVFFAPKKWQQRMNWSHEDALVDASALSRINAWHYCWNMTMDHPLMGAGFEAFTPTLYKRYAPNTQDVHGPHSIYFGVLAEQGFPGLFLYLTLLGSCFLTLARVRKYAKNSGDERAGHYAALLQFSLVAFMVSGAFLGRQYFDYFFTLVACTMALRRLTLIRPYEAAVPENEPVAEEEQPSMASIGRPMLPAWPSTWTAGK